MWSRIRLGAILGGLFVLVALGAASAASFTQVTPSTAADKHPTWTHDGADLIFESNRTGQWHLFRVPASGGTEEQISFGTADELNPSVSPDGTKIVFASGQADPVTGGLDFASLWIMPVGGGAATRLTPDNPDYTDMHPFWSPDGLTIYFTRRVLVSWMNWEWGIWKVPATGGPGTVFFHLYYELRPVTTPDGARVALQFRPSAGKPFNIAQALVSNPADWSQLTFETTSTAPNDYSPDGGRLAYCSRKDGGKLELFELKLSSGVSTQLTFDGSTFGVDAANDWARYSPDGNRLAFSSLRVTGDYNIWVLDSSGGPPVANELTVGDARGLPTGGPIEIAVDLHNVAASPGLEFRLQDLPDHLTVTGVEAVGRASGLAASFVDAGVAHILLYGSHGEVISPGSGTVLTLQVTLAPQAPLDEIIHMNPLDVALSDAGGDSLPVQAVGGLFTVARQTGDINGDNRVDLGDVVRLVEIILGTGQPPTPEELAEADCNDDTTVNVLDITCLVNLIMSEGPAPSPPVQPTAGPMTLAIDVREDVKGLEFELPAGVAAPEPTADLAPFVMRTGHAKSGARRIIAYDPAGSSWPAGKRAPFRLPAAPHDLRAYGPGGRSLPVVVSGSDIRIGGLGFGRVPTLVAAPNPFRGSTVLHFRLPAPDAVEIHVYDVSGRQVAQLSPGRFDAGEHSLPWKALDASGRDLPAGLYFGRIEADGLKTTTRIVNLGGR